jgi:hypothetical protein
VSLYYDFNVSQGGGTLRVIVLDNSAGSLEASAPGQTAWLEAQLASAQAAGLFMVVFASEPLDTSLNGSATDGSSVAAMLAAAGVLAVFTTDGSGSGSIPYESQTNQMTMVPFEASFGAPQIPEYAGATLGYQQSQNNGVLWYFVSINTSTQPPPGSPPLTPLQRVTVKGIPVVQSLVLEPLSGLTVTQSSTLSFQAIGQRPPGTLATTVVNPGFPGYANYVSIPASNCSGCIGPSYSFASSDTSIGDFVVPTAPGSQFPLIVNGHPVHSSSSGLFCAYNPGTTTVTVTSGLLSSSYTVTVTPGIVGSPCGSVTCPTCGTVVHLGGGVSAPPAGGSSPPPPPTSSATPIPARLPHISLPVPLPPKPTPAKARPPTPPVPRPLPAVAVPPTLLAAAAAGLLAAVIVPPIPPPVTPIPPGGATAQAAARREEKARKRAQQSGFATRPAGVPTAEWFYPAVAVVGLFAIWLAAQGLRPGHKRREAWLEAREEEDPLSRPRRRP